MVVVVVMMVIVYRARDCGVVMGDDGDEYGGDSAAVDAVGMLRLRVKSLNAVHGHGVLT